MENAFTFAWDEQKGVETEIKKRIETQRFKLEELRAKRAKKEEEHAKLESQLDNLHKGEFDDQWVEAVDMTQILGTEAIEAIKSMLKSELHDRLVNALITRLRFDKDTLFSNHRELINEISSANAAYRDKLSYLTKNKENIVDDLTGEIIDIEKRISGFINPENKCERKWIEMSKDNELKLQFISSLDFQIERQNGLLRQYEADYEELKAKLDAFMLEINGVTDNGPKSLVAYENLTSDAFNKKQDILKNASSALSEAFQWFADLKEQLEEGNKGLEDNSNKLKLEYKEIIERKKEMEDDIASIKEQDKEFDILYTRHDELKDLQFELSVPQIQTADKNELLPKVENMAGKLDGDAWQAMNNTLNTVKDQSSSSTLETKRFILKAIKDFKPKRHAKEEINNPAQLETSNSYSFDLYSNHDEYFFKEKENSENWNNKTSESTAKKTKKAIVAKQLCINN